jgi:hypothetical protein
MFPSSWQSIGSSHASLGKLLNLPSEVVQIACQSIHPKSSCQDCAPSTSDHVVVPFYGQCHNVGTPPECGKALCIC